MCLVGQVCVKMDIRAKGYKRRSLLHQVHLLKRTDNILGCTLPDQVHGQLSRMVITQLPKSSAFRPAYPWVRSFIILSKIMVPRTTSKAVIQYPRRKTYVGDEKEVEARH